MTDLHTHILPGMDDGPRDPEAAAALLERQLLQGVDHVALTSHYNCEAEPPECYLGRRAAAFSRLQPCCPRGMTLKLGCEVYFSPTLLSIDAGQLCLEGTRVLLLELPVLQKPAFLREVLTGLRDRGIVPLIAHAERYSYVQRDPRLLADWMAQGALIQVNAQSVIDGGLARKLIRWGLCQVVASDAHSQEYRPPNLRHALDTVAASVGSGIAELLERNASALFSGGMPEIGEVHIPKRMLGIWL